MYQIKVGVLVEKTGKLLLIREANSSGEYGWNTVRTTLDEERDANIFEAATRACRQEVNVEIELKSLLNILILRKNTGNVVQIDFVATIKDGKPEVVSKKEQEKLKESISEVRFFSKEELVDMAPLEFLTSRAYAAVQDWIGGRSAPLDLVENQP